MRSIARRLNVSRAMSVGFFSGAELGFSAMAIFQRVVFNGLSQLLATQAVYSTS